MGVSDSSPSPPVVSTSKPSPSEFHAAVAVGHASNPLRDKRILAEAKRCATLTLEKDGVCIISSSAGVDTPWTAYIQGPLGTIWEDAVFEVNISFPSNYPWQPLHLRFTHGIFHPNVSNDGSICNRLAGDHWSPALGPGAMLTYTRALLDVPNFSAKDRGVEENEDAALNADELVRRLGGGSGKPLKLYHYTCREAITSISQTRELQASCSGVAGPGIYATTMHPTNCTKQQIERNNWGASSWLGSKTNYVVELDVATLQEEGYAVEKVQGGRDVWLIKRMIGTKNNLLLSDSNSVISDFEHMASCEWNKEAGRLFREKQEEYGCQVVLTVQAYGQQIPGVARQTQGTC